jgi:hypothetical protein
MGIDVRLGPKTILYLGQRSRGTSEVLALLAKRPDLRIVHILMPESVAWALSGATAHLVLVGPDLASNDLSKLFATVERLRPGVPVMAVRPQIDDVGPAQPFAALTVVAGLCPTPVVLHLVDMALGAGVRPQCDGLSTSPRGQQFGAGPE